jgi:hypothetical protein
MIEVKCIQRITSLNIHEQEMSFRESAAASLHPISRDPEQYRSYIADDDSVGKTIERCLLILNSPNYLDIQFRTLI